MVAVIRERKDFDKHRENDTSLQAYCNSSVDDITTERLWRLKN